MDHLREPEQGCTLAAGILLDPYHGIAFFSSGKSGNEVSGIIVVVKGIDKILFSIYTRG